MHYAPGLFFLIFSFLQSLHTPPWSAVYSEFSAFLAVLAWGWGAAYRHAITPIYVGIPIIASLCASLVIAAQYATGQITFGGDAIVFLGYAFLGVGTLLIAQWHGDDAAWPAALAFTLLLAALASALIALIQALGVWTNVDWIMHTSGFRRPGANLGQPNHLGTLLVMGAASLIYLAQRFGISRWMAIFLGLLLMIGLGITESRTGLLTSTTLCLWWLARAKIFTRPPHWYGVAVIVLMLVAIMGTWPLFISHVQEAGPLHDRVMINTSDGNRLKVWQQLCEAMWIKPWLGWGLRSVSTALHAVLPNYLQSEPFTYAHNIILDMAIGMGLPLTAFAACAAGIWLWQRVKNTKTLESWYAIGLLIPFVMHSLLEYPFAYAYFLVPTMLAVGLLELGTKSIITINISRKMVFIFIILFGMLAARMGFEYVEVEEDFRIARFENLNVGQKPADYVRPHIILLTQLDAMVAATRTTPRPAMPPEEIELLRVASSRFPWISLQSSYALSLALNGKPREAMQELKIMRAMHGKKVYEDIQKKWNELARTKYPQLDSLALPSVE